MAVMRVQHIYNPKSAQVEDQVVNTFYFAKGAGTAVTVADTTFIDPVLNAFYDEVASGAGTAISAHVASVTMASPRQTNVYYDMNVAKPRPPIARLSAAPSTANTATMALPSEVAVCLSYRGALTGGTLPARRRGRLYIGPLHTAAGNFDADALTGHPRPAANMRTSFVRAALAMKTAALTQGWVWSVYSPTARATGLIAEDACTPIVHVWCDDAFDTQRRRGVKATTRITLNV